MYGMSRDSYLEKSTDLLRYAARRASQYPFFLAADMDHFRSHLGMEETDLARFLGCLPDFLPKLALCRRPDPDSPQFRSDIQRIAGAFGLQTDRLVQLIREVDVLESLGKAAHTIEEAEARGLLLAARDLEESAEEETPDGGSNGKEEAH
jgi:hypothetical protein